VAPSADAPTEFCPRAEPRASTTQLDRPHQDSETLRLRVLYVGSELSVHDVCCRPHDFAPGAEECSSMHQIVFPRRGVFERKLHGKSLIADPNQVLFFGRDEPYRVAHPAGCGDDCTTFSFRDRLLREALGAHDPDWAARSVPAFRVDQALVDPSVLLAQEELRAALRVPHVEFGSRAGARASTLAVEEAALSLLDAALGSAYAALERPRRSTQRSEREHRAKAQQTAQYLATHFAEDQSLTDIGRAVGASPYHLARLFRRHAGLSVHQYRHQLRLSEALRRIAEGETNLSQLALALGFASHSHLSDSVRKAFGTTPRALRSALAPEHVHHLSRNLEVGARPEA
jgi:AraC family transcriptional regulator